jgi:hypothetical protein
MRAGQAILVGGDDGEADTASLVLEAGMAATSARWAARAR